MHCSPKNPGMYSAQLSHNSIKDCLIHCQKPRLWLSSTSSSLGKECRRRNGVAVACGSNVVYELKCHEHWKNSHAKTKSQKFQRHQHPTKFQHRSCRNRNTKGRQGEAFVYDVHRMSVLGKSPKEARATSRAELEAGFYICRSGKKKVRTQHQLCRCYLLPGVTSPGLQLCGQGHATKRRIRWCLSSLFSRWSSRRRRLVSRSVLFIFV